MSTGSQIQNGEPTEASMAELVKQLSEQTTRLVHQEIELAKAELTVKGKRAAIGGGMFGGAGVAALYAVGAIVAAAIALLSLAVATWLAALIIGIILAAVAAVLALTGKNRVQAAVPPLPERATQSVKDDVQTVKTQAQAGRQ